jgi:hypothetical protein
MKRKQASLEAQEGQAKFPQDSNNSEEDVDKKYTKLMQ